MSDTININIKSSGDQKYEVSISPSKQVADLKKEIAEKASVPADSQRLIYSGKVLKDNETISSYKVQSGHTIHLVKGAAKKASTPTPSSSSNTPSEANESNSTGAPSNLAAGTGSFNPLADLTGGRYAGFTQLPSASMFGPDGGMNSVPDPDQMSQMMSNPMFQESMNSLLSNPQMLDYMINQSPQLRAMGPQVREMMLSPFFRQMMSNPEMMRSMMEMSRNFGGGMSNPGGPNTGFPAPGGNPTVDDGNGEDNQNANLNAQGTTPQPNPFASMFPGGVPPVNPFSLFGGSAGDLAGESAGDTRPPEERYEQQLRQLNDMGFFDFDRNVAALRRSGGSVEGALEFLLTST